MIPEIESKWKNIEILPGSVSDVSYIDNNHILLETDDGTEYELIDFAATKLFRMTGMKKKEFQNARVNEKYSELSLLLDSMEDNINGRSDNNPLVLRMLKEDDAVKSIVGKSYIPIDMEELEAHAEHILREGGISNYVIDRYKTEYARGHDTTRYIMEGGEQASAVGDLMGIGLQIKNNELGTRGISVSLFVQRLACLNGMCSYKTEQTLTTTHLGNKESLLVEFDQTATRIVDSAWNVLDEINRVGTIKLTQEQMNNFVDHTIFDKKISGKIGSKIKLSIEKETYGANKNNVWGLINAITGVSSHDSSHGVKDKLEIIASNLLDMKDIDQIEKKLIKLELPN